MQRKIPIKSYKLKKYPNGGNPYLYGNRTNNNDYLNPIQPNQTIQDVERDELGNPIFSKGIDTSNISNVTSKVKSNRPISLKGATALGADVGNYLIDKYDKKSSTDLYGNKYNETSELGDISKGALDGAAAGASFGPIGAGVGAVIGGGIGYFQGDEANKAEREAREKANQKFRDDNKREALDRYSSMKAQGFNETGNKYASMYKDGGTIHINPANKGKFNALKERTGKSTEELTHSKNPLTRKRAIFAQNAKKWKHADGGNIDADYEVEGNEVVQGDDTNLQNQQDLASDMTKAVGASHENGGVKGEGGERVFSDRIKIGEGLYLLLNENGYKFKPKSTYAEVAIKLGKDKGKFEEKTKSHNGITNTTGKVMLSRIDNLIDQTFNEQEMIKQIEENTTTSNYRRGGYFKRGGVIDFIEMNTQNKHTSNKLPKKAFGDKLKKYSKKTLDVLDDNQDQLLNAGVAIVNYNNADKQQTNINRQTPAPTYVKAPNIYGQARYDINRTTNTLSKALNASGNPQDNFARKAVLQGQAINEINDAAQKQGEIDVNTNNANAEIANRFNILKSNNTNEDLIDKAQGRNAILSNKQKVANTFLEGYMGNQASKRAYAVDRTRMAISGMDSGRGTTYRSAKKLLLDSNIDPETRKVLEQVVKQKEGVTFSKGGTIRKSMMKKYC